ncbi:MAG: enoyl-CoA hydratase-related protein [Actinomycetota bacterium]
MGEETAVRYEVGEGVAKITLCRPEVLNAMNGDVFQGLLDLGQKAASDPEVRAVVVCGEGRAFCSGLDVSLFAEIGARPDIRFIIPHFQECFSIYERMGKPTVAAVHGVAYGAGLQLAIACDLRVASEDARFAVWERRFGLVPDLGGTQRLPRLVGLSRAKDMVMTARVVEAAEAAAIGLADRLVPAGNDVQAAMELAADLAAAPPLAVGLAKQLLAQALDTTVAAGLEREAVTQMVCLGSADHREAVMAYLEKRKGRFEGR